jgi:hypothetical protein
MNLPVGGDKLGLSERGDKLGLSEGGDKLGLCLNFEVGYFQ